MSKFSSVTIMLGAVTETDSLRKTVETVISLCNSSDIAEIIISYPDRITPECKAVVDELANADYPVRMNVFPQIKPFMAGISGMMDAATGSHCILLASDMAFDLDFVPKMIELVKKEPDTIFSSSRWLPGCEMHDYGKLRKVLNFCAQKFLMVLYGVKLTDFTNPCQIAPTELYQSIEWEEIGFPFLLEMVLKPVRLGYKFVEVPTNCYPRTEGKSSNNFFQTASYLKTALHIRFMRKESILKKDAK